MTMAEIHALYRIFDADNELLYVGITNNPTGRMMDHLRSQWWAPRITQITFEHFGDRGELKTAERRAITTEGPVYNVAHAREWSQDIEDDTDAGWFIEEYGEAEPHTERERASLAAAAELMGDLLK
jgi:hypothetical protein